MRPLIAIAGPTATGKSSLAVRLAEEFNGEVVSADSRQVYRYMDIGTAKLSPEELAAVTHHLIDIINPDEDFSLADYKKLADKAVKDIHNRGKLPLLTGGSGLYVWAVLEGWNIPEVPPDSGLRNELEERAAGGGADGLYRELMETDPAAAQRIDRRNVRRVIRALEVSRKADGKFSELQDKNPPPYSTLIIGLTADREELYRRTDSRVDIMIESGFVEEVEKLVGMGYGPGLPAMSGIGYRQILMFLNGEITLEEAVKKIKTETHRLVRRQYNWFSLKDRRIHWFDIDKEPEEEIRELVKSFLAA